MKWERRFGAICLVFLCISVPIAGSNLYGTEAWKRVQVYFYQEGLGHGPAELQMYVNCKPKYNEPPPVREGVVDLGWMRPQDVVTVQALFGEVSVHLEFHLIVNGHVIPGGYANPGGRGNQQGGKLGAWLVHRSYSAEGALLAGVGCHTHHARPALELNGPSRATYSTKGDWLGTAETMWPWIVAIYAVGGLVLAGIALVLKAVAEARGPRLLPAVAAAVLGLSLGVFGIVKIGVSGEPYAAAITVFVTTVTSVHWLRFDLARGLESVRRRLLANENGEA